MKYPLMLALLSGCIALAAPPARAQTDSRGYCREYTRTVVIGGRQQNAYGTACLQPDGAWEIQNEDRGALDRPEPSYAGAPVGRVIYVNPVPPPPQADVTYVIHDDVPVYVQPNYIYYRGYRRPAFAPVYRNNFYFGGYGNRGYDRHDGYDHRGHHHWNN